MERAGEGGVPGVRSSIGGNRTPVHRASQSGWRGWRGTAWARGMGYEARWGGWCKTALDWPTQVRV